MSVLNLCQFKWLLFSFSLLPYLSVAEEMNIAVASNFSSAMSELVLEFEKNTRHKVNVSYGSSGKLYAQIRHGAPYQLFFSADQQKPAALEKASLVKENSQFTYAVGQLVLWTLATDDVKRVEANFISSGFKKVALANPRLAPYGLAAQQVINRLGLTDSEHFKWLQGENVSQSLQFVSSGNADFGFVALSQVLAMKQSNLGTYWQIPDDMYDTIYQDVVLLKRYGNSQAAIQFLDFVSADIGRNIIRKSGYNLPIKRAQVTP